MNPGGSPRAWAECHTYSHACCDTLQVICGPGKRLPRFAGEAPMELELLIITNLVAANAMPNTAPGWSGNAFGSCAPFLRSLLSLPPQVSCLLIVSDNVINKNSKCGGDGRVNGLAKRRARLARRTEANFRPRGQTLLSRSLASGLWEPGSSTRQPRERET